MNSKLRIFINLTTGLQALEDFKFNLNDVRFIRIQSTHCEQKKFEEILSNLSDDFLMSAALGYTCLVFDYGARSYDSKAIRIGLEWIRYFLNRVWFDNTIKPIIKNNNVGEWFNLQYKLIPERTKKKILFFKKFLCTKQVNIIGITKNTLLDNNQNHFIDILNSCKLSTDKAIETL